MKNCKAQTFLLFLISHFVMLSLVCSLAFSLRGKNERRPVFLVGNELGQNDVLE
jgi:hypothetical protein